MIVAWSVEVNSVQLIKTKGYENDPEVVVILAHGAGAPADSPFMEGLADALANEGIESVRFEFPYMQKRRMDGRRRPPDREPALLAHFSEVLAQVRGELGRGCRLLVGGKSMGGRMATLLASQGEGMEGVVCYGYPFHPPGKPDRWRTGHFPALRVPTLIVQGTRDPFGRQDEVSARQAELGDVRLEWLDGGNHDLQPLKRQALGQDQLLASAAAVTRRFIDDNGHP